MGIQMKHGSLGFRVLGERKGGKGRKRGKRKREKGRKRGKRKFKIITCKTFFFYIFLYENT